MSWRRGSRATPSAATSATTCAPGTSALPGPRRSPSFGPDAGRWHRGSDLLRDHDGGGVRRRFRRNAAGAAGARRHAEKLSGCVRILLRCRAPDDPQLERLLHYDLWANRETLKSLGQAIPPPRSLKWMGHIVGADFLWLARLESQPSELPVWPDLSLKECGKRLEELSAASGGSGRSRSQTTQPTDILHQLQGRALDQHGRGDSDPRGDPLGLSSGTDRLRPSGRGPDSGVHRLHPCGAAGPASNDLSLRRPVADRRRAGIALIGRPGLVRRARLVRPAARGHPDRAGHGADLHPAGLHVPGLGGAEPHHVSHQSTVLGAIQR